MNEAKQLVSSHFVLFRLTPFQTQTQADKVQASEVVRPRAGFENLEHQRLLCGEDSLRQAQAL